MWALFLTATGKQDISQRREGFGRFAISILFFISLFMIPVFLSIVYSDIKNDDGKPKGYVEIVLNGLHDNNVEVRREASITANKLEEKSLLAELNKF